VPGTQIASTRKCALAPQTAKPSAVRSQRLCLVPHTCRFLGRQSLGCRAGTGTRPHPSVQRGAPKPDSGKIIARVTAFLRLRALRSFGGCHARRTWMCFLGNAREICCRDGLTVWSPFADDTRASTFEDASKSLSNWGARREAKTSRRGFSDSVGRRATSAMGQGRSSNDIRVTSALPSTFPHFAFGPRTDMPSLLMFVRLRGNFGPS
jgi:hypothetical protein